MFFARSRSRRNKHPGDGREGRNGTDGSNSAMRNHSPPRLLRKQESAPPRTRSAIASSLLRRAPESGQRVQQPQPQPCHHSRHFVEIVAADLHLLDLEQGKEAEQSAVEMRRIEGIQATVG